MLLGWTIRLSCALSPPFAPHAVCCRSLRSLLPPQLELQEHHAERSDALARSQAELADLAAQLREQTARGHAVRTGAA